MATYRASSPITSDELTPRPSSVSVTDDLHHSASISRQRTKGSQRDDSISAYTIIPAEEELHGGANKPISASPGGIAEGDLNKTEKHTLLYQPLDKVATLKQWTLEFVALFASVVAFTIMVILLVVSHEKPQPAWAYSVSINSIVAILTTLIRAAMLFVIAEVVGQTKWSWMATPRPLRHVERFDNAGRGAWGSLKFLIFIHKSNTTVLAALVVIASYATGPLSQQAVRTYSCDVLAKGTARISIAERVANLDSPRGTGYLNPKLSTAAITGLLAIPSDNSQLFQCDSGNCVFDATAGVTHSSVGMCSKCTDVRSDLQEFEPYGRKFLNRYLSEYRFHNNSEFGINTHVEPTLFSVVTNVDETINTSFLTLTVAGCVAQPNTEAQANRYCGHDYKNMPKLSSDLDIVAANCSLYPCLRYYHGSVRNGTLDEQWLSSDPMDGPTSMGYVAMLQPCILDGEWYDSSNITLAPRDGLNWTYVGSSVAGRMAPIQCVRSFDSLEMNGIRSFLEKTLVGSCHLFDAFEEGSTSPDAVNSIGNNSMLECDSGWVTSALYGGGTATFEGFAAGHSNMATAITNRMRVNGRSWSEAETSNSYKMGTCSQASICISLQYWWLLYPAALLVLTSALLISAYVQSCRYSGRQPIWKSAILPLLFYTISKDYDSEERNDGGHNDSSLPLLQLAELESLADKTIVSFRGSDEGARFNVENGVMEVK